MEEKIRKIYFEKKIKRILNLKNVQIILQKSALKDVENSFKSKSLTIKKI